MNTDDAEAHMCPVLMADTFSVNSVVLRATTFTIICADHNVARHGLCLYGRKMFCVTHTHTHTQKEVNNGMFRVETLQKMQPNLHTAGRVAVTNVLLYYFVIACPFGYCNVLRRLEWDFTNECQCC